MMEHPITPPPELVQQWLGEYFGCTVSGELSESERYLATASARWGADQELEACINLLSDLGGDGEMIRRCRRPKPPSLKEQALEAFQFISKCHPITGRDWDTIRRALEQLDD